MNKNTRFLHSLLHLFYPHSCCGCGSHQLDEQSLFCIYCLASMPVTQFEFFPLNPIEKIFWGRADIETASAHFYFTGGSSIQHSLHLLKYGGRKEIGLYFGRRMGRYLKQSNRFSNCELIIPLPLFKSREKKRGYNQSTLIATGIATQLKIPVVNNIVSRTKKTASQTQKSRMARWENIEATFQIENSATICGKHVLLVDDVITTGASLEACARVLLSIPGIKISVACLAHTVSA